MSPLGVHRGERRCVGTLWRARRSRRGGRGMAPIGRYRAIGHIMPDRPRICTRDWPDTAGKTEREHGLIKPPPSHVRVDIVRLTREPGQRVRHRLARPHVRRRQRQRRPLTLRPQSRPSLGADLIGRQAFSHPSRQDISRSPMRGALIRFPVQQACHCLASQMRVRSSAACPAVQGRRRGTSATRGVDPVAAHGGSAAGEAGDGHEAAPDRRPTMHDASHSRACS